MNREQMIEKVWQMIYGGVPVNGGELLAAAVVDALLPQVTTVEELDALPTGTKVVDSTNRLWSVTRVYLTSTGNAPVYTHPEAITSLGPLTVVWQP